MEKSKNITKMLSCKCRDNYLWKDHSKPWLNQARFTMVMFNLKMAGFMEGMIVLVTSWSHLRGSVDTSLLCRENFGELSKKPFLHSFKEQQNNKLLIYSQLESHLLGNLYVWMDQALILHNIINAWTWYRINSWRDSDLYINISSDKQRINILILVISMKTNF